MREYISIFKYSYLLFFIFLAFNSVAAESGAKNPSSSEEEIVSGPFSGYGEFGSSEDEAEDEKFFQYGRFFGIAVGTGVTAPTGNAAKIYQGGFPTLDFKLLYWFDFNFALSLGIENSKHAYDIQPDGITFVNLFRFMPQLIYYFDTHNLAAPLTFIGPHLIIGGGMYKRTDNIGAGNGSTITGNIIQEEQAIGFNAGFGFELTLKPKRTYIDIQGMMHFVSFNDQYDSRFSRTAGIPDKRGNWASGSVCILFTW